MKTRREIIGTILIRGGYLVIVLGLFLALLASIANAQIISVPPAASGAATVGFSGPGGRLTLTSNTPVMTADATARSTIFYDTFVGRSVPISGTNVNITANEISVILDATHHVSGGIYDVFAINSAGLTLCIGPAWTLPTARGTGAGTTELEYSGGVWTNKNSLTNCWNNSVDKGPVALHVGTYLGTFMATANGQTGMQFAPTPAAGGTNNILNLYNAYNRVTVYASETDSTVSWTNASSTWIAANASNSNRISWIDGLAQSQVRVDRIAHINAGASSVGCVGIDLDSTSATPTHAACGSVVGSGESVLDTENIAPQLGSHFAQAVEANVANAGTATFVGLSSSVQLYDLSFQIMM